MFITGGRPSLWELLALICLCILVGIAAFITLVMLIEERSIKKGHAIGFKEGWEQGSKAGLEKGLKGLRRAALKPIGKGM